MKKRSQVRSPHRRLSRRDLVGGDAALDFVNTVAGRDASPRDRIDSYERLLEWATLARLLPERVVRTLARRARAQPRAAAAALTRAKALREAMFRLVEAVVSGAAPPKAGLALLREHWLAGARAHELVGGGGRVAPRLGDAPPDLDFVAAMAAHRMVERVLPSPMDRLRICRGPDCAWLFLDTSKAGRRRWCDMAVCGNAAKSRRFHARSHPRRRRARRTARGKKSGAAAAAPRA